jgi:predicted ribosomally synthesized peptide with SipW-like signal peptide
MSQTSDKWYEGIKDYIIALGMSAIVVGATYAFFTAVKMLFA